MGMSAVGHVTSSFRRKAAKQLPTKLDAKARLWFRCKRGGEARAPLCSATKSLPLSPPTSSLFSPSLCPQGLFPASLFLRFLARSQNRPSPPFQRRFAPPFPAAATKGPPSPPSCPRACTTDTVLLLSRGKKTRKIHPLSTPPHPSSG